MAFSLFTDAVCPKKLHDMFMTLYVATSTKITALNYSDLPRDEGEIVLVLSQKLKKQIKKVNIQKDCGMLLYSVHIDSFFYYLSTSVTFLLHQNKISRCLMT